MGDIPPYVISKLNELPITNVAEKLNNSMKTALCLAELVNYKEFMLNRNKHLAV